MKLPKFSKKRIFDIAIIVFVIIAFIFIRKPFFNIINPFVYALIVSYLLNPLVKLIEKQKIKRIYAILLVFIIIFGVVFGILITFIPSLSNDISVFIKELPDITERFVTF